MKKFTRKAVRFKGLTIGLDLHKQFIEFCVLDQRGEQIDGGRFDSNREALGRFLAGKQTKGAAQFVFEACGCFIWVFDELVQRVKRERIHVAHASRLKAITCSKAKTDANDAYWLAYYLWEGRLPEAFVAEGALRDLRIAAREFHHVSQQRGDALRRFRAHLAQEGLRLRSSWHLSKKGRQAAAELIKQVRGERRRALEMIWHHIKRLTVQKSLWRQRLAELSQALPEVPRLIAVMPGFGQVVSAMLVGELGLPQRYHSEKAYAKATGLTPGQRESGGRCAKVGMTREGSPHARWALVQAVMGIVRSRSALSVQIKTWAQQRMKYKSKKCVYVAVARKLAEGVWRLFALGEIFDLSRAFPVARAPVEQVA